MQRPQGTGLGIVDGHASRGDEGILVAARGNEVQGGVRGTHTSSLTRAMVSVPEPRPEPSPNHGVLCLRNPICATL